MPVSLHQAIVIGEEFAVSFDDGTELYIPITMLRRACPCANCQGEPDALGRVVKPQVELTANSFVLKSIDQVGGYALQLHWGDGHGTGLYGFDYLRRLAAMAGS